jgi:pyruvate kinase
MSGEAAAGDDPVAAIASVATIVQPAGTREDLWR